MMSMNTMPEAPSRATPGNSRHCSTPETKAVSTMALSRGMLPYFSSMGGPMTRNSSMLFKKWLRSAWPSTWPNSRM